MEAFILKIKCPPGVLFWDFFGMSGYSTANFTEEKFVWRKKKNLSKTSHIYNKERKVTAGGERLSPRIFRHDSVDPDRLHDGKWQQP